MALTRGQLGPLVRASRRAKEVMAARDLDEWQREYGELAGRFVQELGLPLAVMNGNDESIATVESRLRSHVQAAADSWVDASSEQASLRLVLGLSFYLIDILLRRTDGLLRQSKFGDLHVAYSYDTQGRIAARPLSIFAVDTARGYLASMALAEPTDMAKLIRTFSRRRSRRNRL